MSNLVGMQHSASGVSETAGWAPISRCIAYGPGRDPTFRLPHYATELNGLRTVFFDAGEGEPIVFIHGLAGNASHFLHIAPRFAERARVVGLDLPACGASEAPATPLTVDGLVEQVVALLDRLELPSAILVGHSLGGMVALRCAIKYPARVRSMVLINSAGLYRFPLLLRWGSRILHEKWLSPVLKRGWKRVLGRVFHSSNARTQAFIENVIATHDPERDLEMLARVIADLSKDVTHANLTTELAAMPMPIWKVWGSRDRLVPGSLLRAIARKNRNVIAEEIPDCGHMPIIEKPEPVVWMIERALANREQHQAA